ncbi:MAG: hypothetical protein DHS80DRAFT_30150 [Piptocephalis tieghemiana]|nr:MAG: hypothetical protein DHS80DRAFT_30150 [Piptocephalis tieghemiana]
MDQEMEEDLFGPSPWVFQPVPQVPGLWIGKGLLEQKDQSIVEGAIREIHPDFLTSSHLNQSMSFGASLPRYAALALKSMDLSQCEFLQDALDQEDWELIREGQYFTQTILNGYLPGQGIRPHVDLARFGHVILGISLGSGCNMNFTPVNSSAVGQTGYDMIGPETQGITWTQRLEPGDVYIMTGEARWKWMHGIPECMVDPVEDDQVARGTRISITLRRVINANPEA